MIVDLSIMPSGKTYEDRYGGYMDVFKKASENKLKVINPPHCWKPLLWWLGVDVEGGQCFFEHDYIFESLSLNRVQILKDRTLLEMFCTIRPELTDALWKADMEWNCWFDNSTYEREFIITNNASFHRSEIRDYLERLNNFKPTKNKCVLVPCAADKPYPSVLHKKVLDMLPDDYHLVVASGVTGLVPMELWEYMPYYDSGLPYEWRLLKIIEKYFTKHDYKKVVVYCDFYNEAIYRGLASFHKEKVFVTPIRFYYNYLDLLNVDLLKRLKESL